VARWGATTDGAALLPALLYLHAQASATSSLPASPGTLGELLEAVRATGHADVADGLVRMLMTQAEVGGEADA
jgi:hypothetical protein